MYTNYTNPLDLKEIFVNIFAGNAPIFFLISLAVIVFFAAKFRMTGMLTLGLVLIFSAIGLTHGYVWMIYPIVAIIGMIIAVIVTRMIKGG